MKELRLERLGVTVQYPEGAGVMVACLEENHERGEACVRNFRGTDAIIMLSHLMAEVLQGEPDIVTASMLGVFRTHLKQSGVLGDGVDMAVAFQGHVLPLDEMVAEAEEEYEDEEKDR